MAGNDIPSEAQCLAMLDAAALSPELRAHILKVTEIAVRLATALQQRGIGMDLHLVRAGALLHDVAKGEPNHEEVGARRVREKGWPSTARIVAQHADLPWDEESMIDEVAVVYLADRLVGGPDLLGVEERFRRQGSKYGNDQVKLESLESKEKHALFIESIFSRALGEDVMSVLARA